MVGISFNKVAAGLCLFGGLPQLALANEKALEEVRVGVLQHNICISDCTNANKENGPNVQAELVFKSPKILRIIKSPRPYIIASLNTGGTTSYGAIGLNWNVKLGGKFSLEPGFGYAIHNGEKEPPYPRFDERNVTFNEENLLLGSRDQFRTSLSLNRELTEKLSAQITFEHLSHGYIIGGGHNQGLDNLGLRIGYKF